MSEIKVLIEGYAREIHSGWRASSTVTLIKAGGKNIIVDPGCNRKKLILALGKEKLKTGDIDFVLLTHNHADHSLLAGIFQNAKVLTTEEIYDNDNQIAHNNKIPGTDLKIMQTPGHCSEHCSLIVTAAKGVYAIAGDVFWWTNDEDGHADIEKEDSAHPNEVNMRALIESRKKILELADYIIPGHGKMFRVDK
ncbi:Hydroxyacylglutathione hydrolase [uncultured archaeon]|nr:Hydroxyacylglutathione hydrolase [uncultured archaeon]